MSTSTQLFPGQEPNEKVKAVLRRHWIKLFGHAVWFVIQTIIPLVAASLIIFLTDFRLDIDSIWFVLVVLAASLYYLFITLFFFADLVGYHLDVWVVTDQRIVSMEQLGLFDRVVSQQPIQKVQDVTHEVKGQMPTLFGFGNVRVQTAGEEEHFVFEDVPHPDQVAKLILQTHEESIRAHDERRVEMYQNIPPIEPPPHRNV